MRAGRVVCRVAALAAAVSFVGTQAVAQEAAKTSQPPTDASEVGEAIQPPPTRPGQGPEYTIELYDRTAGARHAWANPPPPRWNQPAWQYGGKSLFFYSTHQLPESGLPKWARYTLYPFAGVLDFIDLPIMAVAGLYGS